MNLAVIQTGGKQYVVTLGDKIKIEKIIGDEGASIKFADVLLHSTGNKVEIGTPHIKGVVVEGKVLRQGRGDKKITFKYSSKARYHRTKGHRQHFTEVEITKI
ncbi:MAG: 50S ribosomal protein L21 [Anaplasmataceae bacterium]|nr:50S ribosomal protein L21 [Anaplasmataceae bacterium]